MRKLLSATAVAFTVFAAFQLAAAQPSTQEQNKALARSFFEVLDQGHLEKYSESHAANFVAHGRGHDYTLEEDLAMAREERKALPDMHMTADEIVAERDLVVVRWSVRGTNTGDGMGFPATGKKITASGMTMFRCSGGKLVEEWSAWDQLSVMQQAGLIPGK